ncbi:sugar ABC transporter ATP-binding protein, partial [Amnibacterium flavum]
MASVGQHSFHYGSSGTYLPVKEKRTMASVTFDQATRLYPGSTR